MKTFNEIFAATMALNDVMTPFNCKVSSQMFGVGVITVKLVHGEKRPVASMYAEFGDPSSVSVELFAPTTSYLHISTEGLDQAQAMGLFAAFVRENFT